MRYRLCIIKENKLGRRSRVVKNKNWDKNSLVEINLCLVGYLIEHAISSIYAFPYGGTPLNNPLIDFCALFSKSKLHF